MKSALIDPSGLKDLSGELLQENGKLKLLSAREYDQYNPDELRLFCHNYARYGLPTTELMTFLRMEINRTSPLENCIEIGAGSGDLGYHLGIKMTDSKQQDDPKIAAMYDIACQPRIKYPQDVEKLEALEAVYKYKPKVVIGSWITTYAATEQPYGSNPYGIREDKILKLVDKFIIIGSEAMHGDKPILKQKHICLKPDWLRSRRKDNVIYIFEKEDN